MKIIVTGAAGLIGSHLCDIMLQDGHEVTGIDDLSYGDVKNIPQGVDFIQGLVENLPQYEGKWDVIYHLASWKKVWDGSILSSDVMSVNFAMTQAVVDRALADGSKLVFASTSDIYGNSETFHEEDDITMGAPVSIRYSYALSKWHSEQYILNMVSECKLDATIVRVFGCASSRSNRGWSGGHVPLFTDLALKGKDITIHGDGLQTRSISHAIDIATGFSKCFNPKDKLYKVSGIVNIGTTQQTTVKYIAEYIIDKTNSKSKVKYIPSAEVFQDYKEIKARFPNVDKAVATFNYKVNYTTEQVVDEIIQEFSK